MGERGPVPARTAERTRVELPADGAAMILGPGDLAAFGYDVDLNPLPPKVEELRPPEQTPSGYRVKDKLDERGWHPFATHLWESLMTDPSRKWTGGAQWAVDLVMVENISRMMMPRIAGWEEGVDANDEPYKNPVWESRPMAAAEINAMLAWAKQRGLDEWTRLRLRKEITFYDGTPTAEETAARGEGVVAITKTRAEALAGYADEVDA